MQSTGGCTIAQKAMHIQQADGKGMIFAADAMTPAVLDDVTIPVIRIDRASGHLMLDILQDINTRLHPASIVLSSCEAMNSAEEELSNVQSGTMIDKDDQRVDFLALNDVNVPTRIPALVPADRCTRRDFVLARVDENDVLIEQIQRLVDAQVKGIVLVDESTEIPRVLSVPDANVPILLTTRWCEMTHITVHVDNSLKQQWRDLDHLNNPLHWPANQLDRNRLYYRLKRSQDARFDSMLTNVYDAAQHYFERRAQTI